PARLLSSATHLYFSECSPLLFLLFFLLLCPPPRSTLFPYTTLFRSQFAIIAAQIGIYFVCAQKRYQPVEVECSDWLQQQEIARPDRKSTRLNSSHVEISYAVFCLKKKKKTIIQSNTRR